MNDKLKKFIEDNIDLIEDNKFDDLYKKADVNYVGQLTQILIDAAINPLPYMNHIVPCMYQGCNITSIVIPDNIEYIHYVRGFGDNPCLEYISLPSNLTSLGYQTFYGCTRLNTVDFRGTLSEFYNIKTKVQDWAYGSSITEVVCSDGKIHLQRGKDYI